MTNADDGIERLAVKPARAALLVDCSRSKVYDAIASGELKATRIAGMIRVPMEELRRWVAGRSSNGGSGRDE